MPLLKPPRFDATKTLGTTRFNEEAVPVAGRVGGVGEEGEDQKTFGRGTGEEVIGRTC